jgi:hypothetical protein
MIDIFVQRGAGDKRGPDITDPLITELSVALSRGQVEVDKTALSRSVQMSARFRPGLECGQLVQVVDALQGAAWRGKITSIDNAVEGAVLMSRITVERIDA